MTEAVSSTAVAQRRIGGVLHLEITAPRTRNALSRPLLAALGAAVDELDETVTGIVISGSGGTFSAGADFGELSGTAADVGFDETVAAVTTAIRSSPRIVVAAIEGPCIGAAADIALACDLRVGGEGCYLQIPAVRLGLLYNPDALDRMRRTYPGHALRRLLLLGERVSAREALVAGLVSVVVPRGDAVDRAITMLSEIRPEHLPALAATKKFLADPDPDPARWQQRRRELLDSPARRAAVEKARCRHTLERPGGGAP
ncbi:enoyl-CoA hydratase [Pseudonocardia thermophila]|uniref:Enoyl-CoA hydratase n=1 Tax=Pseudonocardia thermophila TaxID=1848 RepID=A0A1M6S1V2_PSETH|nr:enoyl-CoA hydratase/isomerase family protein [Pseudonocardia thermophila]SHK38488.1 enoyl-CoA hydratase [Pseudonocardia thermophila]